MRLQSSEGLTEIGGPISKMVSSQDSCKGVSVPYHVGFSTGLPKCPDNMAAGFSQSKKEDPVPFVSWCLSEVAY